MRFFMSVVNFQKSDDNFVGNKPEWVKEWNRLGLYKIRRVDFSKIHKFYDFIRE